MREKAKKLLIALGIGAAVVGASSLPIDPKPMTLEEYQLFIETVNYETKTRGELKLHNVSDRKKIAPMVADAITKRDVTENDIVLRDVEFSKKEYRDLKEHLNSRFKSRKVIDAILDNQ